MKKNFFSLLITFLFFQFLVQAQENTKTIEEITAVVGGSIILKSDIERQYLQYKSQGYVSNSGNIRCEIFEELLIQKLLLNQAKIDSLEIPDSQINSELEGRLNMMISQAGTVENLENFMGKTILQIKDDFRKLLKEQLLTQRMQGKITEDIKITPSQIRKFYKKIPKDSLPMVNENYEIAEIVKRPEVSLEEKNKIKKKLRDLRKRIISGENFSTLAILYSEDPGSAKRGGELGFVGRNDIVPEFAAVAFNLRGKETSKVVETEYGYHVMQLIERRGERINVRHILLKPKVSPMQMQKARKELDSIKNLILNDSISFEKAVELFSQDEMSKNNKGIMLNPKTGNSKFETSDIEPATYYVIKNMKENNISLPFESIDTKNKQVYKIVKLNNKTDKHLANMKDDYQFLQSLTLQTEKQKTLNNWVKEKQKSTYIKINEEYKRCSFQYGKWIN